jgi:hypothetical protein
MDLPSWLSGAVSGALCAPIAVAGLARRFGDYWLGRLLEKEKTKYAKEMEHMKANFSQELERYRPQLDRSIFVTRAHFETEFTAMKEISQQLSQVKISFLKLHPIEYGPEMTDAERVQNVESLDRAIERFHEKLQDWTVLLPAKTGHPS